MARTIISTKEEFDELVLDVDGILLDYKFEDKTFTFELEFNTARGALSVWFKNCIFKEKVSFPRTVTLITSLDKSTFEKDVTFKGTTFKGASYFDETTFEQAVSFDNANFKSKAKFHKAKFKGNTNFNNAKFEDLAVFWNAEFNEKTIFNKTDFLGRTVFSDATFFANVLFSYTLIDKIVIFRGTKFEEGVDLSLAIISGSLNIFDIEVDNFEAVEDTKDAIQLSEYVTTSGDITRKNKRETFRIIKNWLLINHNSIDALKYANLEMQAYREELMGRRISRKYNLLKKFILWVLRILKLNYNLFLNRQDRFLLWLNGISNKHNTSWLRGGLFTISIAMIFFYLSILNTENYEFGFKYMNQVDYTACFKYFFTSILPTHNINYLENEQPKMFFYIWDFLGRIFISYGIYQTIQAFRKYKSR